MNRHRIAGLVSLCAVLLLVGTAMNAAAQTYSPNPVGAPIEPNPWVAFNVTKDYQTKGWTAANFLDNTGTLRSLPAEVDGRVARPYSLNPGNMYAPGVLQEYQLGAGIETKPSGCSGPWNDTSCWSKTDIASPTSTLSTVSVDGVGKALRFKSVGATAKSNTTWTYDLVDITSDFSKYRFIVSYGIFQLSTAATARIEVLDTLGFNRSYKIDNTGTLWQNTTCAYRVHSGIVAPGPSAPPLRFLDERPGDGVFGGSCSTFRGNIAKVRVQLSDDSAGTSETADIVIYALRFSVNQLSWGTDDTGATINNMTYQTARTLATFSPTFSWSQQGHMTFAMRALASDLVASGTSGAYGGFLRTHEEPDAAASSAFVRLVHYRFDFLLPSTSGSVTTGSVNLAFANLRMDDVLTVTKDHYKLVTVNQADKTTLYTCASCKVGTTVALLASGITAGSTYTVAIDMYYTEPEWNSISEVTGGVFVSIQDWVLGAMIVVTMGLGLTGLGYSLARRKAGLRNPPPPR